MARAYDDDGDIVMGPAIPETPHRGDVLMRPTSLPVGSPDEESVNYAISLGKTAAELSTLVLEYVNRGKDAIRRSRDERPDFQTALQSVNQITEIRGIVEGLISTAQTEPGKRHLEIVLDKINGAEINALNNYTHRYSGGKRHRLSKSTKSAHRRRGGKKASRRTHKKHTTRRRHRKHRTTHRK